MKNTRDPNSTEDVKPKDEPETAPTNNTVEAPIPDSASISASSNDLKKVSREDIELVQNLIERCLQLYMNRDEVVKTLLNRARIDPGFTTLVWQKLEEENAAFFRAYYIRLKLKKLIVLFNQLLEHQYNVMKYPMPPKVPLAPMHNGIHPIPVQSTTYLWGTPSYSNLRCLWPDNLISILCAIPLLTLPMEFLFLRIFTRCE